jgi:hypothetical protein
MIYEPEIEAWKDRDFKTEYFDDFLNKYAIDGWEVLSVFQQTKSNADYSKINTIVVFRKAK